MAGVLLGLILSLYAAAAVPAFHHFWHGDDDDSSECHESDCVVVAFANGNIEPGPVPELVMRSVFFVASEAILIIAAVIVGFDHIQPPGRGPPVF